MGLCWISRTESGSSYNQTHTLAVTVFTVTVLWKVGAAVSSHPTICQRGCFSILGIASETHRPIHILQTDMLALDTDCYKHQLWDGTGACPAYCKLAQGLDFYKDRISVLLGPTSGFLISFSGEAGSIMDLAPFCSPVYYLRLVPTLLHQSVNVYLRENPSRELHPISHMAGEMATVSQQGPPLCP